MTNIMNNHWEFYRLIYSRMCNRYQLPCIWIIFKSLLHKFFDMIGDSVLLILFRLQSRLCHSKFHRYSFRIFYVSLYGRDFVTNVVFIPKVYFLCLFILYPYIDCKLKTVPAPYFQYEINTLVYLILKIHENTKK